MSYCDYVNVFHGCGKIDLPKPEGIAAKWFFIKAQCGNTSPAACIPFGGMSVGPYSGGYPTGYGNHKVNCHSDPQTFEGGDKLYGFTHLQQSGTGTIGYYYNYALTVPKYNNSAEKRLPVNEKGEPGYYSCVLDDILCEVTADNRVAYHKYSFGSDNGLVSIDFSNNGLNFDNSNKAAVNNLVISGYNSDTVCAEAVIEGIKFYFSARGNGEYEINGNAVTFKNFGKKALIKLSFSNVSPESSLLFLNNSTDFEKAKESAYTIWNNALSSVSIESGDDRIKRIFYSNLYHSLIKPSDRSGDGFIYRSDKPFMTDFATLWDMYKTAMPLICMLYKDVAEKSVETLMSLCEKLGNIPNSIGFSDAFYEHSGQARSLGCYVMMTAYRFGIKIDMNRMLNAIRKDIFADNKRDFTIDHKCKSHTWMLDMSDCCGLAAEIAAEAGETDISAELKPLSSLWKNCYDRSTGLLDGNSDYYEGTLYNYSFRQMKEMDERIEIAGGKERFVKFLDKFFGYGQPDVIQPKDPNNPEYIDRTMKRGIFEGFNNESDTEAPYSYIYAGRHDRTCEILRAGMKYMFSEGRGGLPGNNDSGALSSYYVFSALGIFPVAGQNLFLIGSPFIDKASLTFFNGNKLNILVEGNSPENIYVEEVRFNDRIIDNYRISADEIMKGGILEFKMSSEYNN
ncbi:MAG: glycoside hydrolase family 92 protein [Clostridia bacterium]|nr:glycoside hydrolase family 92 protein [Clostridia bacterium]